MAQFSRRHAMGAVATASATLAGGLAVPAQAWASGDGSGAAHGSGQGRRTPLRRAHAHNDYARPRPLFDALSHGFTSVEADIWLVDGQLLVAHDEWQLNPNRTLESLYLDPLLARVRAGGGRVYRDDDLSLQLLIGLKTDGEATYRELSRRLRRYHSMLSIRTPGRVRREAVTAVISGNRAARGAMEEEWVRLAFYDGRLDDLRTEAPPSFVPLISCNWTQGFSWQGRGTMPRAERDLLHQIVATAHAAGQRVRFWATPDRPGPARQAVWHELLDADVDHINTDDLAGLEDFLRTHDPAV